VRFPRVIKPGLGWCRVDEGNQVNSVVMDPFKPPLTRSSTAATALAGSARRAGQAVGDRYRIVLKACGEISDRRHWAAKRSSW
jgi:hypothetical protein